jgi:hypothetical protein
MQVVTDTKVGGEGVRAYPAWCGMGILVHACAACFPICSRWEMREGLSVSGHVLATESCACLHGV